MVSPHHRVFDSVYFPIPFRFIYLIQYINLIIDCHLQNTMSGKPDNDKEVVPSARNKVPLSMHRGDLSQTVSNVVFSHNWVYSDYVSINRFFTNSRRWRGYLKKSNAIAHLWFCAVCILLYLGDSFRYY